MSKNMGMGGGLRECQRTWEWEGGGGSVKEQGSGGVGEVWAF